MAAYLVLLLAALSRLLPHAMHGVGLNFTAVGGSLLFFGARRPRWQAIFAVLALALTDVYLTTQVYGYAFHVRDYLLTWAWYAAVVLLGHALLQRVTALRVVAGIFASATGFFVLSNLMVFAMGSMYPHTAAGLGSCFALALPFYGNDLVSTAITAGALFGLPVLAAKLTEVFATQPAA
jgi:hypothetical protein